MFLLSKLNKVQNYIIKNIIITINRFYIKKYEKNIKKL